MKPAVFITGTDTGIGKTMVSRALIAGLVEQGMTIAAMKPIASGCEDHGDGLQNEDALMLAATSNVEADYTLINPYAFEPAIAPHIAAQQVGVEIAVDKIRECQLRLQQQAELVVIEGVGGWQVPLDAKRQLADLVLEMQWPVILVVGMRLGCLNHALLTMESIQRAGVECLGWIANQLEADMPFYSENLQTLKQKIDVPYLGSLSYQPGQFDESSVQLDWAAIEKALGY